LKIYAVSYKPDRWQMAFVLYSNKKMQLRSLSRVILVALRTYDSVASLKLRHSCAFWPIYGLRKIVFEFWAAE